MTARPLAVATLLLTAAVAGCGVTPDDAPRVIDPPRSPFQAHESPSPAATTGANSQTLFLVKDGKLVVVTRHPDVAPTLDYLVAALVAGPTASEREQDITSALLGSKIVAAINASDGQAVVELAAPIEGAPRTDEVLAYAQLVCTLTTHPDVTGVTFIRDGRPVAVPRADGVLSQGPLTAADYAPLIA
ncbi:MAG TPA: GerMN domain-containing protein [Jiangellales bacterium]|nr:GerMN domain-containing protein [Jiangellales bacterium]